MTCPLCGAPTSADAARCPQCGAVLPGAGPDPEALPVYGAPSDQPGGAGPEVAGPSRYRQRRVLLAIPVALLVLVTVVTVRGLAGDDRPEARELDTGRIFELPPAVPRTPSVAWEQDFDARQMIGFRDSVIAADANDGDLAAFSADDGDERWRVDSTAEGRTVAWLSPLGDGDILVAYASEDSPETDLQVESLDGRTGRTNWRYDRAGVMFAYPAARDIVAIYRFRPSSDRYVMSILSAADGEERWTVRGDPRAFGDRTVYVSRDGRLVAHDIASGAERWSRNLSGDRANQRGGAEAGSTLVLGRDRSTIVGLSVTDGRFLWSRSLPRSVETIRGTDGVVVVTGSDTSGVDADSGEVLWSTRSGDWKADTLLGLDGQDDVFAMDERIARLDPATGASEARSEEGLRSRGRMSFLQPSLADGVIYLGEDQEIVAVDLGSLERIWTLDTGIDFYDVVAADRAVVVATNDELIGYR